MNIKYAPKLVEGANENVKLHSSSLRQTDPHDHNDMISTTGPLGSDNNGLIHQPNSNIISNSGPKQPIVQSTVPSVPEIEDPNVQLGEYREQNLPTFIISKFSREFRCPSCNKASSTSISREPGTGSWLLCIGMVVFGCWPCACLPFCVEDCQDTKHVCPNCSTEVGRRKFLFDS